jgi:hypothetical protein
MPSERKPSSAGRAHARSVATASAGLTAVVALLMLSACAAPALGGRTTQQSHSAAASAASLQGRVMLLDQSVTVYEHCNYEGRATRIPPGRYTYDDLMVRRAPALEPVAQRRWQ